MSSQDEIRVRAVCPEDRENLRVLCQDREYPTTLFQDPDEMRTRALLAVDQHFEELSSQPNVLALVAECQGQVVGYALAEHGAIESITHHRQTVVADHWAPTERIFQALYRELEKLSRRQGDEYLVTYLFTDQDEQAEVLEYWGYNPELLRVAKSIDSSHQAPSRPEYRIRRANSTDMLFIMTLVAGHSPIYCPAHREGDLKRLQQRFVNLYAEMDPRDKTKVPLVIEDRSSRELLGYIIVEPRRVFVTEGRLILYIYDIAVSDIAHGKGLSRYLCGGGEALLAKMGGGVFFGDISADNVLAVGAQKGLGFRLDSTRWGLRLTE